MSDDLDRWLAERLEPLNFGVPGGLCLTSPGGFWIPGFSDSGLSEWNPKPIDTWEMAGRVIEAMEKLGWQFSFRLELPRSAIEPHIHAVFYKSDTPPVWASAYEKPFAIALAARAALEGEDGNTD